MKNYHVSALIAIAIFFLPLSFLKGNAILGGDLSYTCLGDNSYQLRLVIYQDCAGGNSAFPQAHIRVSSTLCGQQLTSYPQPVSIVPTQIANQTPGCGAPASTLCYAYYQFLDTVMLSACRDWEMIASVHASRPLLSNVSVGSSFGLRASLDNAEAICGPEFCNQSAFFYGEATQTLCVNKPYSLNPGIVDIEGDSLVVSFDTPRDSLGGAIAYTNPYTINNPVPNVAAMSIDPSTGVISFTPNTTGAYALPIKVDEYRLGKYIGSSTRSFHIDVVSCLLTNQTPAFIPASLVSIDRPCDSLFRLNIIDNNIFVCWKDSFYFDFYAIDFDPGDSIIFVDSLIPDWLDIVPTYNQAGDYVAVRVSSVSLPEPQMRDRIGIHTLAFYIADRHCPGQRNIPYTIKLYVSMAQPGGVYGGYRAEQESFGAGATSGEDITWGPVTMAPGPTYSPGDPPIVINANIVNRSCIAYLRKELTYAPVLVSPSSGTLFNLGTDSVTAAVPLGFDFPFFCGTYNNFYVSSGGWVSFDNPGGNAHTSAQSIPQLGGLKNFIAYLWGSFDLNGQGGSTLNYVVTGTAPNQKGILTLTNGRSVNNGSVNNQAQLVLYEGSGRIEVHVSRAESGTLSTIGIEDDTERNGVAARRRNAKIFTINQGAEESWVFEPYRAGYTVEWENVTRNTTISYNDTIHFIPQDSVTNLKVTLQRDFGVDYQGLTIAPYYECCPDELVCPWCGPLVLNATITSGSVLPVNGVSLEAIAQGRDVQLRWDILGNKNEHYVLEHAYESNFFEPITQDNEVGGYVHASLSNGLHYYRLRAISTEGKVSYSNIAEALIDGGNKSAIVVYPNPASRQVFISHPDIEHGVLQLVNIQGKIVISQPLDNDLKTVLNVKDLPGGIYFVRVSGSGKAYAAKVQLK